MHIGQGCHGSHCRAGSRPQAHCSSVGVCRGTALGAQTRAAAQAWPSWGRPQQQRSPISEPQARSLTPGSVPTPALRAQAQLRPRAGLRPPLLPRPDASVPAPAHVLEQTPRPSAGPGPNSGSNSGPGAGRSGGPAQAAAGAVQSGRAPPRSVTAQRRGRGPGATMASGVSAARAAEEPPAPEPPAEQKPPPAPPAPAQEEFSFLPLVHDIIKW